jgi:intracellular multiplication protein IcmC
MSLNCNLKSYRNFWHYALLFAMFLTLPGCSSMLTSFHGMTEFLVRLQSQYRSIVGLIISFAYLAGAAFVMKSIFAFKVYGEQRTMMSQQTTIKVPLTYLSIGMALLFLPQVISIATMSLFLTPTVELMGYSNATDTFDTVETAVYGMIQIVGLIAVVRALFIVSHQNSQQGGMGKAIAHFAGGIAALNVTHMVDILNNEFS